MTAEAVSTCFYEHKTNKQKYPRLQLRTVKELMEGKAIERPSNVAALDETFKKPPKPKPKATSNIAWAYKPLLCVRRRQTFIWSRP